MNDEEQVTPTEARRPYAKPALAQLGAPEATGKVSPSMLESAYSVTIGVGS